MKTRQTESDKVTEYISKLDSELSKSIQYLRKLILDINPEIKEQIKWNSPSFYYAGEMKEFDPKEYKRDIAVTNLHRGNIMIVFPTGAKIVNPDNLLEGNYPDGRKIVKFRNLQDIKNKEKLLKAAIIDWLSKVEK